MKKRNFRGLKELYDVTEEVSQPKITPVLKGGYRIQGPADESDCVIQMNVGLSGTEIIFDRRFTSGKFDIRAESGTCNVSATLCSSCMHFDPAIPPMGLKSDNLSDEACQRKADRRCSSNDNDSSSSLKSRAGNDGNHTSSETSNLLSACSSHNSFSENAESKASLRVSDSAEGIAMLLDVSAGQTAAEDQASHEPQVLCGNRIFSNQHEKKDSERNGDDISCVSGADGPSMMDGDHSGDLDRKNVSCSSVSVNSSLLEGFSEAVNVQPASYSLAGDHYEVEEGCNCSNRPANFMKESLQETAPFSDKLDPSEISSLRVVYAGTSLLKGDLSECSIDQVESSSVRLATSTVDDHKHDGPVSAESIKFKFEEDLANKVVKCSDQNADLEMPTIPEPPLQSQSVECNDGPDLVEDVKVCDICGDAGREDYLAICSKCSDGAEHIYCMHIRLDKVPEGHWMCEECVLLEDIEKQKKNKFEQEVGNLKGSSLDKINQNTGTSSTANDKICLDVDIEGSNVERSRRDKVSSLPQFPTKRPAGNLDSASMAKTRAIETGVGSPGVSSLYRKAPSSQDSPLKTAHDIPSSADRSSDGFMRNSCLRTISGHNSPKLRPSLPMSQGTLTKSNSFNISHLRLNVQRREGFLPKQKFSRETATSDKKKDGTVKMIGKSLSFDKVSAGRSNVADSKSRMLSSNFSRAEDLKRLRHAKEHNSIQKKNTSKLDKPRVSLPMAGSCVSALKNDKKIASHGELLSPHSSGINCLDLKAVQRSRNSSNSLKPVPHLAHEGSKYPDDLTGTGVVKRQHSCLPVVVQDPSFPITSDTFHELKPEGELVPGSSLTASRHWSSSDAIAQDILPLSRESSNQVETVPETSYFSWAGKRVSAESRSVYCHKCNKMGHAAESCLVISPQASVVGARSPKNMDQSNQMNFGPKFHIQPDETMILAVPRLDYMWKGGFEMRSSGSLPSFCYGIQAHLSTRASPKVLEVVKKFPDKVVLEEVPRSSMWPTQFLENHPKEDSIGLYFFAEDLQSYGRNYKSLLECMINYDLALKGNIDGIELLIFSSNLLPKKSQCWNKLFFLWGIFRGRRVNDTECMPSSQKKPSTPYLNNVLSDQEFSIRVLSGSQNMCSSGLSSECLSASRSYYNVKQSSNSIFPQETPSVSSGRKDGNQELKLSSPKQKYFSLQTNFDQKLHDDAISLTSIPIRKELLCRDMQCTNTPLKECGVPERKQEDCQPCLQESSKYDKDWVAWRGDGAYDMKVTENSGITDKPQFSAIPGPVGGMLGVKSSQWQVRSSDHEDQMEFECLDLDLSIGAGKKSAKQGLMPGFLGYVDKKNDQDKNPNSVASNINNNGGDEFAASLNLSLGLHTYNK